MAAHTPRPALLALALLALALLALAPGLPPAIAQEAPAGAFSLLGRLGGLAPTLVARDGDRLYLASAATLTIADLGVDDSLTLRGSVDLPHPPAEMAAANGFVYLISNDQRPKHVMLIDASDPDQPRLERSYGTNWYIQEIEIYQGRLYMRHVSLEPLAGSIVVYNLADPAAPQVEVTFDISVGGVGFPISGNMSFADGRLYMSTGEIFDLGPEPRRLGLFASCGDGNGTMVREGAYLYYGYSAGLCIYEARDPNPVLRSDLSNTGDFSGLLIKDGRIYVPNRNTYSPGNNLRVYDIADNITPRLIGQGGGPAVAFWRTSRGFYGFVPGQLKRYNIADPAAISAELLWTWDEPAISSIAAVRDSRLYHFVDGALTVTDLSDPALPARLGSLSFLQQGQFPLALDVQGDLAFVVLSESGGRSLQLLDLSDPANPRARGRVSLAGVPDVDAYQLRVEGATLLLDGRSASHTVNLGQVEIGDPDAPRLSTVYNIEGKPVYVADGVAFLPLSDYVRFHDAASGQVRGLFPQPRATDIAVRGDILYLAHEGGLTIVDIGDLARSELLGSYSAPKRAIHRLLLQGERAYLYSFSPSASFTQALDVSDPAAPRLLGFSPQSVLDLQPMGATFVGRTPDGLMAVDPASGKTCCGYRAGYVTAVRHLVDGERAYLVDNMRRLHILQPPGRYDFPPDISLPLLAR